MKQVFSYTAILLLASIFFTACRKSSDGGVPKQANVYVFGGFENLYGYYIGGYWKNGVFTAIDNFYPASGYVSGNDVYVAGYKVNITMYIGYCKNGIFTKLDSSSHTDTTLTVNSIIVSGSNVYVSETYDIYNNNSSKSFAKYWKNGVETDYTNNAKDIDAGSIFVSGNDVYVCGVVYLSSGGWVPKYWKNGVETILASASDHAYAQEIFVSGYDVYVAGNRGNYAGYWKNGAFTTLTNGSQSASARFIYVSGNDIYVAGYDGSNWEYWKNGAIVASLSNTEYISSMYVLGSDVYIGVGNNPAASYLKNGVPTYLNDGVNSFGKITSIFVTNN